MLDTGGEYWEECYTIEWDKDIIQFLPKVSELYEPEEPLQPVRYQWTVDGFVQEQ